MKVEVTTTKPKFKPIILNIELETREELECFFQLANHGIKLVNEINKYRDPVSKEDMQELLNSLFNPLAEVRRNL